MNAEDAFLLDALQDADAVEFVRMLGTVSQTWDDLVDDAKTDDVSAAFMTLLLELPTNPFYRAHVDRLLPVMRAAVFDWLASNELQRGDDDDLTLAHVLRDSLVAVVVECAAITRGNSYAASNAARIRRYYHDESLAAFKESIR
ncbi:MAG: hypothetical protein C0434_08095 [Xanthomonadaceae bacterium]|nr:hypothetical protein [Xanthomonadaceae bacterium]